MRISVIIPTRNAGNELPRLLEALFKQKQKIDEIIVVDSASTDQTAEICKSFPVVNFLQIEQKEFDHGKTRDMALRKSIGDIVVFLTQDAIPVDERFLSNLIVPLAQEKVAVSTGRQIPKTDASRMEQLVRAFNYPSESYIRSKADLPRLGIKTFFFSDVCAAYNRKIYLELGGFDYPIKTNEDMFFAAKVINSGYRIAYAADAQVYHSHNFNLREQYRRNYIQGYEIERHKEVLSNAGQESEGIRLVKYVTKGLLKEGRIFSFLYFGLDCVARYLGNKNGRRAYNKDHKREII